MNSKRRHEEAADGKSQSVRKFPQTGSVDGKVEVAENKHSATDDCGSNDFFNNYRQFLIVRSLVLFFVRHFDPL